MNQPTRTMIDFASAVSFMAIAPSQSAVAQETTPDSTAAIAMPFASRCSPPSVSSATARCSRGIKTSSRVGRFGKPL